MWYPATVSAPPASEPVALPDAKRQCLIGDTDTTHDEQLRLLIKAARAKVESYCGIRLVSQTIVLKCDDFRDFERVSESPLRTISSICYVDADGNQATVPPADYELRGEGLAPSIVAAYGARWPVKRPGSRIAVTALAGFSEVPADIVSALLLMVAKDMSFSRPDLLKRSETVEGVGSIQWGGADVVSGVMDGTVASLLENYRNWQLA